MIDEELIDEIIQISSKKKFISKDLIKRILFNLIESSDKVTQDAFKELKFIHIDWEDTFCTCNTYTGVVKFDYDKCIKDMKLSSYNSKATLINNLEIVRYLIHEYQHLLEIYKCKQTGIETILLFVSDINGFLLQKYCNEEGLNEDFLFHKYKKIYLTLYDYIPAERIADINSYKLLLDSLTQFKSECNGIIDLIISDYLDACSRGYKFSIDNGYPINYYLNYLCKKDLMEPNIKNGFISIANSLTDLTLQDRFKYGLKASSQEYKTLKKEINREYK